MCGSASPPTTNGPKRVSDALGTATEMKAMKNYAGSRLSPWLGHLMVSRSETARPLLTPGEIMQLPPADEIVMVSGLHPIRAKKARYYEDARFQERIAPPPVLARPEAGRPDDWTARPMPPRPSAPAAREGEAVEDEDPKNAERRLQPELNQETVEKKDPIENEFALDPADELEEDAPRIGRMNDLMQGVARQASLDPGDDLGL
jgi:type IV secretion system protein VirD4